MAEAAAFVLALRDGEAQGVLARLQVAEVEIDRIGGGTGAPARAGIIRRAEETHQLDGRQVVLLGFDALILFPIAAFEHRQCLDALRQTVEEAFGFLSGDDKDGSCAVVGVAVGALVELGEELVMLRELRKVHPLHNQCPVTEMYGGVEGDFALCRLVFCCSMTLM